MILRILSFTILLCFVKSILSEYCGTNKVPFGLEYHRDGRLTLLCNRPNCHEKKYAYCPERPTSTDCSSNTSWVGGFEKTVDGRLFLRCCEYDLMKDYTELLFDNVIVRPGEFYEGEEKMESNEEDVVAFDIITNMKQGADEKSPYYHLTVHRFFCGRISDAPPLWWKEKQWPFFPAETEQLK